MADSYSQIYTFILYSALIGFVLGTVYDFFRIIRIAFDMAGRRRIANVACFICDIFFFIIAAIVSAIFIFHVNNGRIRGIALLGSLAGFILYYNTVGRLVTLVSKAIIRAVYMLLRFILMYILLPVWRFCVGVSDYFYTRGQTRRRIRSFKKKGC